MQPVDTAFFQTQLQSSLDLLQWVIQQFPQERLTEEPPSTFTEWPVQRHLYHLWVYEHYVTVMMRAWGIDATAPTEAQVQEFDRLWQYQAQDWPQVSFQETMQRLITVREEQITLIPHYAFEDWQRKMPMTWGDVSLRWVVSKTIQHASEHTDTLMKLHLWW